MAEKVMDVVCKMWVDPDTAPAKAEYQGEMYYFCAPGCKVEFLMEPDKYLKTSSQHDHGSHNHQH